MEATRKFYEDVLGFPLVRADLIDIVGKGTMRHYFFDAGNGQLIGFMSGEDVQGFPNAFDTSINKGLGLPPGVYHFAFDAESESDLERIKHHLVSNGVAVNGPVNHEGPGKSISSPIRTASSSRSRPHCPPVRRRRRGPASASASRGACKVELESEAPWFRRRPRSSGFARSFRSSPSGPPTRSRSVSPTTTCSRR
jgi:catechol 2,3-dioxygenase-like lactoylglutathione lyase family enzyme